VLPLSLKVVIIGGGSSYTPEIIEGVIKRYESFPITEIALVDIEDGKEKLEIIGNLAKRMIKKARLPINISWTLNRKEALQNADFVATQIRVGGLKAREKDERIPLSHGIIGQETNGAGGVFKAFRTIPVLMEISNDIKEICPEAWMINFTNPAGIVTEALLKYSKHKKIIGVCNIPLNMHNSIAELLNVSPFQVQIEFVGMNHFVFGKKVYINGIDKTELIIDKLANNNFDYSPANIVDLGWSKTFIDSTGLLPNPYHQYYFQTAEVLKNDLEDYKNHVVRAEVVKKLESSLFSIYKNPNLQEKPQELEERGGAFYSDVACSLMDSIYNNKKDIQTVNTLNNGAISDLSDDDVIEVNCVITKNGPKPISVGEIPYQVKGKVLQMKEFEKLVIKAAITGNRNDAYLALVMNPLVADEKQSKKILDEMIQSHEDYLPQFKEGDALHE